MNKLKVLYIIHETFPAGATYSLIDMADFMMKFVEPVFITQGAGKVEQILSDRGWKFYRIPRAKEWGEIDQASAGEMQKSYVNNYEAAVLIANIIRLEKIDLVHSNTSVNNAGAIAAIMACVPHVYHVREFMEEDFGWEYWNKEIKKKIFSATDLFISISKIMEQKFYEKYGLETSAVYDGMVFRNMGDHLEDQSYKNTYKFLQVGIVTEGKGIWDTLNAVHILKERGINNFTVQFIGKVNTDVEKLIRLFVMEYQLENIVELIGHCDDLQEYRRNAEFALVPSRFEGLGRVTAEAMAYGNIVIGADTGGTLELIGKNAERGYLFAQGDAESMADAMERAISEIKEQGQYKRKLAFEFARNMFDASEYGKKIYSKYLEVLDNYNSENTQTIKKDVLCYLDEQYLKYKVEFMKNNTTDLSVSGMLWDKWNSLKDDALVTFLLEKDIHDVAIYGAGKYGKRLIRYLLNSKIRVKYIVDQNVSGLEEVDKIFLTPDEFYSNYRHLPCVDKVIIAVVRERDTKEIEKKMIENNVSNSMFLTNVLEEIS